MTSSDPRDLTQRLQERLALFSIELHEDDELRDELGEALED